MIKENVSENLSISQRTDEEYYKSVEGRNRTFAG